MNLIGEKIHALRRNRKLTQADLAAALSVSAQSVSKWENNVSVPDISLLPIIARYFGITMDELFNYKLDVLTYKERFIRFMAEYGVLQFGKYTLESGRVSPYYINTANFNTASQITKLGAFYAECFIEHNINSDYLMSDKHKETPIMIATATTLFNKYGIDISYFTSTSPKSPDNSCKITLIKDTITSGNSLNSIIEEITKSASCCISDVIISVDRMETCDESRRFAIKNLEYKHNIRIHSIVTLDDIINALEKQIIDGTQYIELLRNYKSNHGGI